MQATQERQRGGRGEGSEAQGVQKGKESQLAYLQPKLITLYHIILFIL